MCNPLLILIVSLSFGCIRGDEAHKNACTQQHTCEACIKYSKERCVWCPAKNITIKRCQTESFSKLNGTWCEENVENPQNKIHIIQNDHLSPGSPDKKIHLTPQKIEIKARPGVPETFNVSYQLGQDYPLDVYLLIDNSFTMTPHQKNLREQIDDIFKTLSKISKNVRMGLGSFVDKPAHPIVDKTLHNAYSFRHHINLTADQKPFKGKIKHLLKYFGSNYEDPEAGLEALMQVMLCKDIIGWRKDDTRRMILLFTDATYHSAGDGRNVGAFRPFDMKCHVDKDEYSMALTLDYPSVGQVSEVVRDEDFHVIFVIKDTVRTPYVLLAKEIEGAECANLTSGDISKIIMDSYMKLLRFPRLSRKNQPIGVDVQLDPPCDQTEKCEVQNHEAKNLSITITLLSCINKDPVVIGVVGVTDILMIDVEAICQCDCWKSIEQRDASICSGNGTYQCGVCNCDENWSGERCDCKGDANSYYDNIYDTKCIRPSEKRLCSGRGQCWCGACKCTESHGDFCEYSDNDCQRRKGKVCSGHGKCMFGACLCDSDWTSADCACTLSHDDCIDPYTQKVCADNGVCECGQCVCKKSEERTNKFCDDSTREKRCKELENVVDCLFYTFNTTAEEKKREVCWENYHKKRGIVVFVDKTKINTLQYQTYDWCSILKSDGSIIFKHSISTQLSLVILNDLDIPPKANIWVVVGSIVGAILLIGVITLIVWRVLVNLHDAREYKKFQAEVEELDFETAETNELYQPAHFEFRNPRFRMSVNNN